MLRRATAQFAGQIMRYFAYMQQMWRKAFTAIRSATRHALTNQWQAAATDIQIDRQIVRLPGNPAARQSPQSTAADRIWPEYSNQPESDHAVTFVLTWDSIWMPWNITLHSCSSCGIVDNNNGIRKLLLYLPTTGTICWQCQIINMWLYGYLCVLLSRSLIN